MTGQLLAVCAGPVATAIRGEKKLRTGIIKTPLEGRVAVGELGVQGDGQADRRYHGGPDKALYAYSSEYYAYWREQLSQELAWGHFGENLCLEGFPDAQVGLGDRLAVGEIEVEVTEPRMPCSKLAWRMQDPTFVKRFARSLRVGYYLAVVKPGSLAAGDPVRLLARGPGPSVEEAFVMMFLKGRRPA